MKKIFLFTTTLIIVILFSSNQQPATQSQKANASNEKPKNIIFLIGDGMGLTHITAGMYANGNKLNLERFKHCGLIKTHAADTIITDSAAGATAFSTGEKTYNGAIGVDMTFRPVKTILEIAEENKLSTGMVAICAITHATPASFIAHVASRKNDEDIAQDFLKTPIDVFIGGGKKFFAERKDGRNLVDSLKTRKYTVINSLTEMQNLASLPPQLAVFAANEHLPSIKEGRNPAYLENASMTAIHILKNNPKGFFLMIEGSQIDWGGHDNDTEYIIDEMIDFDKVIGKVLDFAEKDGNTLVVVTADHETGGFAITGGSVAERKIKGSFIWKNHTAAMVPVFAYGPGAENFTGIYENTAIFGKFMAAFGFTK